MGSSTLCAMPFSVQAYIDDHWLSVTTETETAKDAFATAVDSMSPDGYLVGPIRHITVAFIEIWGILMRKKRLSSVDLSWMIFERMREEGGETRE